MKNYISQKYQSVLGKIESTKLNRGSKIRLGFMLILTLGLIVTLVIIRNPQTFFNQAASSNTYCWSYNGVCNDQCTYSSPTPTRGYLYSCVVGGGNCNRETKQVLVGSEYTRDSEKYCTPSLYTSCYIPTDVVETNVQLCNYPNTQNCATYPEITNSVGKCIYIKVPGSSPPPPAESAVCKKSTQACVLRSTITNSTDIDTTHTCTLSQVGSTTPCRSATPSDTVAPVITLTNPASSGQVTKGSALIITVTASDNVAVTKVDFYNGTTLLSTDTTSPYSYTWTIPQVDGASYAIQAKAYDAMNNVGSSTSVTLTTPSASSGDSGSATGCWGYNGVCNNQCLYSNPGTVLQGYLYTCLLKNYYNPGVCSKVTKTVMGTDYCSTTGEGSCYIATGPYESNVTLCQNPSFYSICRNHAKVAESTGACTYLPPSGGGQIPDSAVCNKINQTCVLKSTINPYYIDTAHTCTLSQVGSTTPCKTAPPSGGTTNPPTISSTINVVSLAYFPIKNNYLDTEYVNNSWAEYSMSLAEVQSKIARLNTGVEEKLEQGTRYHGYSNSSAPKSIDYVVLEKREFLQPTPTSTKINPYFSDGTYVTDYNKILEDNGICSLVNNNNVREIWLWSYTGQKRIGWESNFSSSYGDISNSDQDTNDMPRCNHSYTVYEYNYGRDVSEAVEDHMHQLERIFNYIDYNTFWNEYVGYYPTRTDNMANRQRRCGNVHFPPNGNFDYDWYNQSSVTTDCKDWKIGGGQTSTMNCTQWNCSAVEFFVFWMQNMPTRWFDYIKDFDTAITNSRSLVP